MEASKRLLAAELDLAAKDAERIAAYEKHLGKAQACVEIAKARQKAGRVLDAQAFALEAEIGLLKAGGKPKKAEK